MSHQGSIFACPLFFIRIPFFQQEIEASRSLLLEELPPVLALHLKRFIYNETSGGCQKLLKNIDFPIDLDISKDILSPNSRLVNSFLHRLIIRRIDCVENCDRTEKSPLKYFPIQFGYIRLLNLSQSVPKAKSAAASIDFYCRATAIFYNQLRGGVL